SAHRGNLDGAGGVRVGCVGAAVGPHHPTLWRLGNEGGGREQDKQGSCNRALHRYSSFGSCRRINEQYSRGQSADQQVTGFRRLPMKMARTVGFALAMWAAGAALQPVAADEGMWPLNRFRAAPLQQKYGFTPAPQWLQNAQLASVRFARGCSGSFVSPSGLVMTNYHCAVACIEALSTEQSKLLETGFYAETATDERRCPGMELNQLTTITDVTDRVTAATKGAEGDRFGAARKAVFAVIESECAKDDRVRCEVVTLYHGG